VYKTANYKYLLLLTIFAVTNKAIATDFCVYNNIGLQIALDTASSNNQSDHIRIKKGNYIYPVSGQSFAYIAATGEQHNLTISGGWVGGTLTTCSFQDREIYSTTIDGNNQVRGLLIEPDAGSNARIEITDLNFTNGYVTGNHRGGGLYIDTDSDSLIDVLIERNTFVSNFASYGAAFSQNEGFHENGYRTVFKNNLVVNNHSEFGAAVSISNRNQRGIYLINNTIMDNTTDQTQSYASAGVYLYVSEFSEAFIANNILWNNQINDLWFIGYTHSKHNSIGSQSSSSTADIDVGNISAAPDFLPYGNAYVPRHNSALHNSGHHLGGFVHVPPWFEEDWNHGDYDVTGRNTRINEGSVDIGAFETPPDYPIFVNGFECEFESRGGFDCDDDQ